MTNLKFGDINTIVSLYMRKPRLQKIEHECNCDECNHDEVVYRCSECKCEDNYKGIFMKNATNGFYRCPHCDEKLYDADDLCNIAEQKREAYAPLNNKKWRYG